MVYWASEIITCYITNKKKKDHMKIVLSDFHIKLTNKR